MSDKPKQLEQMKNWKKNLLAESLMNHLNSNKEEGEWKKKEINLDILIEPVETDDAVVNWSMAKLSL